MSSTRGCVKDSSSKCPRRPRFRSSPLADVLILPRVISRRRAGAASRAAGSTVEASTASSPDFRLTPRPPVQHARPTRYTATPGVRMAVLIFDIRPMSVGDILDRTLHLYRRHFFHTLGIAAVPY